MLPVGAYSPTGESVYVRKYIFVELYGHDHLVQITARNNSVTISG